MNKQGQSIRRRMFGWIGCTVLAVVLVGCGGGETPSNTTQTADNSPEALYKANCIACHGADLQGISGPNLQQVGSRLDAGAIEGIIRNGKGSMPSMSRGLNDEQIKSLSAWLAEKK